MSLSFVKISSTFSYNTNLWQNLIYNTTPNFKLSIFPYIMETSYKIYNSTPYFKHSISSYTIEIYNKI